jgi:hypothetical protein
MRICVTILCVIASLASIGLGDEVSIGKLTYSGVTIISAKGGMLSFKTPGGRVQTKAFGDITAMSLKGLDNFNQAEKLLSNGAGNAAAALLRKQIDAKAVSRANVKTKIGSPEATIAKLKDSAVRFNTQTKTYLESAQGINKQLAALRKGDLDAKNKCAKYEREAKKLMRQAISLAKKKGQNNPQVKQLHKQAQQFQRMADDLNPVKIKIQAARKRGEAGKNLRAAKKFRKEKKPNDWQNKAKQQEGEVKKRLSEAALLDQKAKRLAEVQSTRIAEIAKLTKEMNDFNRRAKKAKTEAKLREEQAVNFPKFLETQNAKIAVLEADISELNDKLDNIASGPKKTPPYPAVIRAYEAAAKQNVDPQIETIIGFRLLGTLDRAGWIDQAALQWLRLADSEPGVPGVLACCPSTLAKKGDPRNAKAIVSLNTRVEKIKDAQQQTLAKGLLADLYLREGRTPDAIRILEKATGPAMKVLLGAALLDIKEYSKAQSTITSTLSKLDRKALPKALAIRAKAMLGQAASLTDRAQKQNFMLQAALDFMRIAAFYQGTPQAGESLYNAGKIMETLPTPNKTAAVKAYQTVAVTYAGTPIGKSASNDLKRLKVKK